MSSLILSLHQFYGHSIVQFFTELYPDMDDGKQVRVYHFVEVQHCLQTNLIQRNS